MLDLSDNKIEGVNFSQPPLPFNARPQPRLPSGLYDPPPTVTLTRNPLPLPVAS